MDWIWDLNSKSQGVHGSGACDSPILYPLYFFMSCVLPFHYLVIYLSLLYLTNEAHSTTYHHLTNYFSKTDYLYHRSSNYYPNSHSLLQPVLFPLIATFTVSISCWMIGLGIWAFVLVFLDLLYHSASDLPIQSASTLFYSNYFILFT